MPEPEIQQEPLVLYETDRVVVDFSGVARVNSRGVARLVGLLVHARQTGRRVEVRGLTAVGREILYLTGLAGYVDIAPLRSQRPPAGSDGQPWSRS